jgi:hypothetical protein
VEGDRKGGEIEMHGHNSPSDSVTKMEAIDRDIFVGRIHRDTLSKVFQFRDCLKDLHETLLESEPEEERVRCHIRLINVLQNRNDFGLRTTQRG